MNTSDNVIELIKKFFNNKEYDKAEALINNIISNPNVSIELLSEANFILGNIFILRGEIGNSISTFKKVLSIDPHNTDVALALSIIYNDIGCYNESRKIFNIASQRVRSGNKSSQLVENKIFAQKHLELAEIYCSYNRYDESLFEYNKSISLDPTNLEIRLKISNIYIKKNLFSKALDELQALKNEHPDYLPAWIALGMLYYSNGKVVEARMEWERVLLKDPKNEKALTYLNLSRVATETSL